MPRKAKRQLADMVVKAEDCIDLSDYMLVHREYLEGMREALRRHHAGDCSCIYCSPTTVGATHD